MEKSEQILKLPLINHKERPTFKYTENGVELTILFDTGANIPVWCIGEKNFTKVYPDAIKSDKKGSISGFGVGEQSCFIYTIPKFTLKNNNIVFCIKNLQVAVCKRPEIGCSFIISDTMFSKTDTFIKRRNNKILEIHFDKNEYICTSKIRNGKLNSISVWSQ